MLYQARQTNALFSHRFQFLTLTSRAAGGHYLTSLSWILGLNLLLFFLESPVRTSECSGGSLLPGLADPLTDPESEGYLARDLPLPGSVLQGISRFDAGDLNHARSR